MATEEKVVSLEGNTQVRSHIRGVFRKAYRDMGMFGYVTAEHMEELELKIQLPSKKNLQEKALAKMQRNLLKKK